MRCDCCPTCFTAHACSHCPPGTPASNVPIVLYDSLALCFLHAESAAKMASAPLSSDALTLHFCLSGNAVYTGADGMALPLSEGDMLLCAGKDGDFLPQSAYDGLALTLTGDTLPEPLAQTPISRQALKEKFLASTAYVQLPPFEPLTALLRSFFALPADLIPAAYQLKAQQALLYLHQLSPFENALPLCTADQTELVHRAHDLLTQNLQQRVTIDTLAKQLLINPSTLKAVFKQVYGNSIAAHIREHRMERAAELLQSGDMGMAQIAQQIGYESASKFSSEFRKHFGVLPSEYRRQHRS